MIWNNNDWQGRSKKQVERNYKVFKYSLILAFIGTILLLIISILN
jgi:hypothetical protein